MALITINQFIIDSASKKRKNNIEVDIAQLIANMDKRQRRNKETKNSCLPECGVCLNDLIEVGFLIIISF